MGAGGAFGSSSTATTIASAEGAAIQVDSAELTVQVEYLLDGLPPTCAISDAATRSDEEIDGAHLLLRRSRHHR